MSHSTQYRKWLAVPALALLAAAAVAAPAQAQVVDPVDIDIVDGVLSITGDDTPQTIALRLLAGDDTHLAIDIGDDGTAESILARAGIDTIEIDTAGGEDTVTIDDSEGAFTDTQPTKVKGGDDADTLTGGAGGETLKGQGGEDLILGGDGDDDVSGGAQDDVAFLGDDDDRFEWSPGDGSDIIEGQTGRETLSVTGNGRAEDFRVFRNGSRFLVTRDVGTMELDVADVEKLEVAALGGADELKLDELDGSSLQDVDFDLASVAGGGSGDGRADAVTIEGTEGDDVATIFGADRELSVVGLAVRIGLTGAEPNRDTLRLRGLAGDDIFDASGLDATVVGLTVEGGADDDTIVGSEGDDTLQGGADDDIIVGGPGADTLDGGGGNNTVIQD